MDKNDDKIVIECAELSFNSYEKECAELSFKSYEDYCKLVPLSFVDIVEVNQLKKRFGGNLLCFIKLDRDNLYVIFRGTTGHPLKGNWFFTNFQAYLTEFIVIDSNINNNENVPRDIAVQGGIFSQVLPGRVHQGFYRAFSQLWYGSEPILNYTFKGTTGSNYNGIAEISRFERHIKFVSYL